MIVHALNADHEIGERNVEEDLFKEFRDCENFGGGCHFVVFGVFLYF